MTRNRRNWSLIGQLILLGLFWCGCAAPQDTGRYFGNPYPQPCRMAVVPFKNLSGSQAVNSIAATDEFVTELQQIQGLTVLPVNRVLAKLSDLGLGSAETPTDALTLADALGVDAIIVGAINRYEPYQPPLVAMAVEIYSRERILDQQASDRLHINPADLARAPKPFELDLRKSFAPQTAIIRVFDASNIETIERIKDYAEKHNEEKTPYEWKIHLTQRRYLRFVSHEIIGELLALERDRVGLK